MFMTSRAKFFARFLQNQSCKALFDFPWCFPLLIRLTNNSYHFRQIRQTGKPLLQKQQLSQTAQLAPSNFALYVIMKNRDSFQIETLLFNGPLKSQIIFAENNHCKSFCFSLLIVYFHF